LHRQNEVTSDPKMIRLSCYEKSDGVSVVMTVHMDHVIPGSLLSSLQTY